jgi:ATP-binding cassette subfamily B protein/ATP-binding cassette subfamily C protein
VSFTINRGQRIAIVGENGAGKSTLIKIMSGLYAPTSALDSWHKQLAVLQQDYLSYSFATARDNITFGKISRPYDEDAFNRAIDKAEAREFLDRLPKGADSYVSPWMAHPDGVNGMDLSGGQWQRLALARNFYRQAPIIILDEPTSAIDALAESRIFNHLFADESQTLIIISHRLTTIERADVILMLKAGRIVERGTADELIAKRGEFYTMFESQI